MSEVKQCPISHPEITPEQYMSQLGVSAYRRNAYATYIERRRAVEILLAAGEHESRAAIADKIMGGEK